MSRRQIKKVSWGILFLLGALALLLGKLGFLEGLGFWSVFFSIILVGIIVDGVLKRNFWESLFPIAGLIIIHDELLGLEAITPWPVLGAALLGTIGLWFIFPKRNKWKSHHLNGISHHGEDHGKILSGEKIYYRVNFGDAIKYIAGDVSQVMLESSFGSLGVYFNDAALKDHQANVEVDCSFGNIDLYVPVGWRVVINVANSFGDVNEDGECNPNGENVLYVGGEVSFGNMTIHYI